MYCYRCREYSPRAVGGSRVRHGVTMVAVGVELDIDGALAARAVLLHRFHACAHTQTGGNTRKQVNHSRLFGS